MDKDRVNGAFRQAEGALREAAGKISGDAKLRTEGAVMRETDKAQNAMGGTKDALRDGKNNKISRL